MDAITVSHPPHIFSNVTDNLTSSDCMHRFTRLYKTDQPFSSFPHRNFTTP